MLLNTFKSKLFQSLLLVFFLLAGASNVHANAFIVNHETGLIYAHDPTGHKDPDIGVISVIDADSLEIVDEIEINNVNGIALLGVYQPANKIYIVKSTTDEKRVISIIDASRNSVENEIELDPDQGIHFLTNELKNEIYLLTSSYESETSKYQGKEIIVLDGITNEIKRRIPFTLANIDDIYSLGPVISPATNTTYKADFLGPVVNQSTSTIYTSNLDRENRKDSIIAINTSDGKISKIIDLPNALVRQVLVNNNSNKVYVLYFKAAKHISQIRTNILVIDGSTNEIIDSESIATPLFINFAAFLNQDNKILAVSSSEYYSPPVLGLTPKLTVFDLQSNETLDYEVFSLQHAGFINNVTVDLKRNYFYYASYGVKDTDSIRRVDFSPLLENINKGKFLTFTEQLKYILEKIEEHTTEVCVLEPSLCSSSNGLLALLSDLNSKLGVLESKCSKKKLMRDISKKYKNIVKAAIRLGCTSEEVSSYSGVLRLILTCSDNKDLTKELANLRNIILNIIFVLLIDDNRNLTPDICELKEIKEHFTSQVPQSVKP